MNPQDDQPPAKRVKLDDVSVPAPAPAVAPATTEDRFSFANETGLFASVFPYLGIRAATEPEVGILEYVDPDVPPFAGIIKHR
jgi:hypothetical protein